MSAPDLEIRLRALQPRRSFLLEAPAGSGKTDLLTARFLALLAEVSSPRQILALTYTRKAADAMQSRIFGILSRARRGGSPKHDWDAMMLRLGEAALANPGFGPGVLESPELYRVGTFHSFCASVVRGWPLESGVPPGVSVLEDLDQDLALERAVRAAFVRAADGEDGALSAAFERRLAGVDNRPGALTEQIVELLRSRDKLRLFEELLQAGEDLEGTLRDLVGRYASLWTEPLRAHFLRDAAAWGDLKETLDRLGGNKAASLPTAVPGTSLEDLTRWRGVASVFLTGAGTPYKAFAGKEFGEGFAKAPAAALIRDIPPTVATLLAVVKEWPRAGEDPVGMGALADLLRLAYAAERELLTHIPGRGLDYLELEQAALKALTWSETPGQGLVFFHEHLRHVLVDEAQDMNDLQARLLGKLLEGWEPGDGRTLFVVGDPKQSIYRFRRADVALFSEMRARGLRREGEADFPLEVLDLSANFRSEPRLVSFCNALFREVMRSPSEAFDEVAFRPSRPAREASADPMPVTVAAFARAQGDTSSVAREAEAAYVAGCIAALHGAEPEATVGLLFPARSGLAPYLRALAQRAVPLRLLEGEDLGGRPEVRHLRNLLSALARPFDDLAWAACLRAPWNRIPLAELMELPGRGGCWSTLILADAEAGRPWSPFARAARTALDTFGREPYESTVARMWEALGGPEMTASLYGAAGVANARSFLELLGTCAGLPLEEALERVGRLLGKAYTPPDPRGAFSPVQVMTVHKAKGLEFDHVFAVNLDRDPLVHARGEKPAFRMAKLPLPGRPTLVAASPDRRAAEPDLATTFLKGLELGRTEGESKRLFYVAATRARRSLTLSGTVTDTKGKGRNPRYKASPLARLWGAVASDGEPLPAFAGLGLRLLFDPVGPSGDGFLPEVRRLPEPPPFDPEPLPYRITSPSALEEETAQAVAFRAEDGPDPNARIRGTLLHRLFEGLALGHDLPGAPSVAAALAGEGLDASLRESLARELLEECRGAWEAIEFASLRSGATLLRPEWAIEDVPREGSLRVGRVDLYLEDDEGAAVLDYKTGAPTGDTSGWVRQEVDRYRPQLRAYAAMATAITGRPARALLYFTALRTLVEV